MKYLTALLTTLILVTSSYAQVDELGIPAELKPVAGYARLKPKSEATWVIYRGVDGVNPLPSEFLADPKWFLMDCSRLPVGRYRFWVVGNLKDQPVQGEFTVVIGDPPVVVIPPGPNPPTPPVPPTPVPTPVEVGKRIVMLFRESRDNTVATADMIEDLRNRDAKYLKEKGHSLYVFDPDDTNSTVNSWRPKFGTLKPPFVLITEPDGMGHATLVGAEELGTNQSAAKVLEILNKYGG